MLITAVQARALARSAGVWQQICWKCFMATQLTTEDHKQPSPPCAFQPRLDRCLPGELPAVLGQRHRLTRQQLPHRHFQLLTPAITAAGPEVEHLAAVAEPGLLGRQGRPVAGSTVQATSGAQPRWRCRSSVQPLQRWVVPIGEGSLWGGAQLCRPQATAAVEERVTRHKG